MKHKHQISKNWQKVKLGELVDITSSKRIFAHEYLKAGIPFYRGKEIIEKFNGNSISTDLFISSNKYEDIKIKFGVPQPGDMLLTSVGTLGVPYLVRDDDKFYFKDGNLTWFRNHNGIDNKFLYYWIQSPLGKEGLKKFTIGSSQPALTIDGLKKIVIELPPIGVQKQIASILSVLDDKIDVNNKIADTLSQMAQAIFKEWFVDFKFPGDKKTKFIDSELGEIPEGWGVKKIKDVAKINKGLSYSSKEISDGDGIPMINLANFERGGGFNPSGVKYYNGKYKESNLVRPGEIVIAMTDLTSNREVIGHPARVPSYHDWNKIVISLDVCSLDTQEEYREFLYYLMLRRSFSYYMASSASGTNVAHLSKSVIEDFEFIFPKTDLIEKFRKLVNPIFIKRNVVEMENQKLVAMRDLLLPKLMKGEIRV